MSAALEIAVVEEWTRRDARRQRRLTLFAYSAPARLYVAVRSDPPLDVSP